MKNVATPAIAEIYVDESSQTRNRYLLLGGIIVPPGEGQDARTAVLEARLPHLPHGELKWGKVSQAKLPAYERVVDAFFRNDAFNGVHFHSLVVDTSKIRDSVFNYGDRQIGFNKEIYQLACKFARLYPSYVFHLYPDQRETSQRPEDLRTILNMGLRKKGDRREWLFRRCHFRDSRSEPFLQVVDILLGAIAFQINGHFSAAGASQAKAALCRKTLALAGISNPMKDTAIGGKFTVWHRRLL